MADTLATIGDALPEHTPADAGAPADDAAPTPATGYLLTEQDEAKVVRHVVRKLWEPQDRAFAKRDARWTANKLVRQGVRGVAIVQSEDQARYEVRAPLGSLALPPSPNEADKICRRLTAQLIVDPPVPDVVPEGDTDAERDAAEFATRLLKADGAADALNDKALLRTAEDKASVYGSAFSYHWIDPQGGGWRPLQVQAHPAAVQYDDANPGAVLLDPTTGAPAVDYVTKYVAEDGTLSDSPVGARMQWLPAERVELLTGYHVRFLPETVRGIQDADGVVLAGYSTVGALKRLNEAVAAMGDEQLRKLVAWRPKKWKRLMPDHAAGEPKGESASGKVEDDAIVFWLRVYYRSHAEYPKGADVWIAGGPDGVLLHRAPSSVERTDRDGQPVEECLELPVAQCRQLDDVITDDPYGQGLVEFLAASEEIKASIFAAVLEKVDQILHPHVFLPLGSTVSADAWHARGMGPLLYNAAAGKPEHEPQQEIPQSALLLLEMMDKAQREASGLEAPALGQTSGEVRSGRHAQQLIEQSLTAISVIKQNAEDFLTRLWRLRLQLRRCFYTVPQQLGYVEDDDSYKVRAWTGADVTSSKQIQIARGSFTIAAPSAKAALANEELQTKLAAAAAAQNPAMAAEAYDEYERRIADGLSSMTGKQDNPHLQRVRRQLHGWKAGPPAEWAAPMPQPVMDPMTGQAQVDPATGQPAMQTAPDPANPFADVRPNDDEPSVALLRYRELSRTLSTTRVADMDPAWTGYLAAEYLRMRQAAGVQTVAEQQAAAQQQAMQQQEAAAAEKQAASGEKDKDRAASAQAQERELAQRAASEDLRASTAMATAQGRAA